MKKVMSLALSFVLACSIANASTVTVMAPPAGQGWASTASVAAYGTCTSSGVNIKVSFCKGSTIEGFKIVATPGGTGGGMWSASIAPPSGGWTKSPIVTGVCCFNPPPPPPMPACWSCQTALKDHYITAEDLSFGGGTGSRNDQWVY